MMKMPDAIVYIAMSLDGFIATKDQGMEWLEAMHTVEGEDYGYVKFMGSVDGVLIGRNTYDFVCTFDSWPFDGKKVAVLTNRPMKQIKDEVACSGLLRPILEKLGRKGAKRVYLDGGKTIQAGLREGIVKEMTISVIPILLGGGVSLFDSFGSEVKLITTGAKQFPSGLVQLGYRVQPD